MAQIADTAHKVPAQVGKVLHKRFRAVRSVTKAVRTLIFGLLSMAKI